MKWSNKLPADLTGIFEPEKYKLSQEYDRAKKKFSIVTGFVNLIFILILLLTGSLTLLDKWPVTTGQGEIKGTLLFFGVLAVLADLLGLPFSVYRIFVIEDRFGFNRTTLKTFFGDKLKGYILGGLLGGSILALFVLFYMNSGQYFWIYAWITATLIMFLTTMFYASCIVPLFNRLIPLPDGDLRLAIEKYCKQVGFVLDNVFIMDGSKRSSKANAFFSGIGRKKRIILYDTLIINHSQEELVSILAHEIGHYKRKHTRTGLILSVFQIGLMLFIFSKFIGSPALSEALVTMKVYPQLIPDIKDWPIHKLYEDRDELIQTVDQHTLDFLLEKHGDRTGDLISRVCYLELIRLKENPWKVDPPNEEQFWKKIRIEVSANDKLKPEQKQQNNTENLRRIIHRYTTEIAGNFKESTFLFARKFLTLFFIRLLNAAAGKSHRRLWSTKLELYERLKIHGNVEHIRNMFQHGTVVILPTHL